MDEYLSKETLQEKLNRKKAGPANKRYTEGWNDAILMVKSMIHSEKAADVAPVRHGRWVKMDTTGLLAVEPVWNCSSCGYPVGVSVAGSKYCPNCGCKMDLEG